MKKVLFIQNIVYPIRNPFFEKLKKSNKYKIFVLFLSETASNRKWSIKKNNINYPHEIASNIRIKLFKGVFDLIFNPFIFFNYFNRNHDILISIGWANPTNYLLCFLSKLRGIPYYLWIESTLNEPSLQRIIMRPFIKILIKNSKACIVPGSASEEYIYSFVKNKKAIHIPNSIDNLKFIKSDSKKNKITKILYVGRFSKEKNLFFLLDAIKILEKNNKFKLWLIGYGPDQNKIENYIKIKKIKSVDKIIYSSRKDLGGIYNQADIFILPSLNEPWGFVINEAMSFSLPILSSNRVGSSFDLVKNNINGYIFDPTDIDDFVNKIKMLLDNSSKRVKMGNESNKIIANYTIYNMVKKFNENI